MKLPAFQFYPGDWLRDHVSGCSLAAQGLWLRMMILAHDSERYGYLAMNGVAIPPESIARRCGCTLDQYMTLLAELDLAGVPSRTPEGIIFSRRMVRDHKVRKDTKLRVRKYRKGNGAVTRRYEDENEVEEEVDVGSKRKKESKHPTLEEITAYCRARGNHVNPEKWLAHYVSNGWRVGKNPMRNWKAAVITWEGSSFESNTKTAENAETCARCGGPKWLPSKLQPGRFRECGCT